MRQIAQVRRSPDKIKRVMLYECDGGYYVFFFDTLTDGPCFADTWCGTIAEAKQICSEMFGIGEDDWVTVPDPSEGCQHDIIAPTVRATPGVTPE